MGPGEGSGLVEGRCEAASVSCMCSAPPPAALPEPGAYLLSPQPPSTRS